MSLSWPRRAVVGDIGDRTAVAGGVLGGHADKAARKRRLTGERRFCRRLIRSVPSKAEWEARCIGR